MRIEEARKTIGILCETYKHVISDEVKELVNEKREIVDNTDSAYRDIQQACISILNILTKREYRNVDFSGKPDFAPARSAWKEIPVYDAIKKLEQKANKEISMIFYDDLGKKHHYSTREFDIMFYDTGSFSEVWYDIAYIRSKH